MTIASREKEEGAETSEGGYGGEENKRVLTLILIGSVESLLFRNYK